MLYVDEVNLLHDHLVDLLLDAAALGTCYVERDGVSVRHAARFLLVGTMNPEEGELRPQLLDRFGLTVEAAAPRDPALRGEVVRRRLAYDADPAAFAGPLAARPRPGWPSGSSRPRPLLPAVALPDATLRQVASVCAAFDVDGLRADLVTARAAIAHAAWEGRDEVTAVDVRAAARLALPHRRRRQPFDAPQLDESELDRALAGAGEDPDDDPGPGDDGPGGGPGPGDDGPGGGQPGASHETTPGADAPAPRAEAATGTGSRRGGPAFRGRGRPAPAGRRGRRPPAAPGPVFRVKRLEVPGTGTGAAGRRSRARTDSGHVTGAQRPRDRVTRVHVPATFAAAAPHQVARGRAPGDRLLLRTGDLREARHEGRESNLVLFAVDASGSMAARARMGAVKGAVLSLLLDAYQRRDKVGMVTFRGSGGRRSRCRRRSRSRRRPPGWPRCRPAGAPRSRRACSAPGSCCAPSGSAIRAAVPCWWWSPTGGPPAAQTRWPARTGPRAAGGGGRAQRGRGLRIRPGPAGPGRRPGASPSAAPLLRLEHLAAGPLADSVRAFKEVA